MADTQTLERMLRDRGISPEVIRRVVAEASRAEAQQTPAWGPLAALPREAVPTSPNWTETFPPPRQASPRMPATQPDLHPPGAPSMADWDSQEWVPPQEEKKGALARGLEGALDFALPGPMEKLVQSPQSQSDGMGLSDLMQKPAAQGQGDPRAETPMGQKMTLREGNPANPTDQIRLQRHLQDKEERLKEDERERESGVERDEERDARRHRLRSLRSIAQGLGTFYPSVAADYLVGSGRPQHTFQTPGIDAALRDVDRSEYAEDARGMLEQGGVDTRGMTSPEALGDFGPTLLARLSAQERHELQQDRMAWEALVYADQVREELKGKPPSDEMLKRVNSLNNVIRELPRLVQKKKDRNWKTGPLDTFLHDAAAWTGVGDKFTSDHGEKRAWFSQLGRLLTDYVIGKTGSQFGMKEFKMHRGNWPAAYDDDQTLIEKAQSAMQDAIRKRDELLEQLQATGRDVSGLGQVSPQVQQVGPRRIRGNREAVNAFLRDFGRYLEGM